MEITFGRAIKIESDTNFYDKKGFNVDPASQSVIDTIEGKNFSTYNKETSAKIREFLKAQIGDYSKKTGVYARRINGEIYLFTGKEAKEARNINRQARIDFENAAASSGAERRCRKILEQRDKEMLGLVEDGKFGKPDTKIIFNMHKHSPVLKSVAYASAYDSEGKVVREFNSIVI